LFFLFFVCLFRSWPNFNHRASADPPLHLCERSGCGVCGGLVGDEKLQSTFVKHVGQWNKIGSDLLKREMQTLWTNNYQPKVDAAEKEMTGKLSDDDLRSQLQVLESQLREQLEEQRAAISKRIDAGRAKPFKKCGRCRLVSYCSAECQKEDWRSHSAYCVEKKE
jgi:radical SAM protein with 4Fe4S-binding SPASM domain